MNKLPIMLLLLLAVFLGAQSQPASLQTLPSDSLQVSHPGYAATLARLAPLAEQGIQNADLYYDLGVCHHHLGNQGQAVLQFLRALNIDSSHSPARENLVYIHALDPTLPREPQQPYLVQLFLGVYAFLSLDRLALIVLITALLTTLSLHLLFHYPPDRERGLPVLLVLIFGLLLLVVGGTLLVKINRWQHNPRAVVLSSVALRSAPAAGRTLKELVPATTVTVKTETGSQLQVVLPDGLSGWIDRQAVELVVPGQ